MTALVSEWPTLAYISNLDTSDLNKEMPEMPQLQAKLQIETEDQLFDYLSELPDESLLDDHGQETLKVIRSIESRFTLKPVSVRYWYKGAIDSSEKRFDMAFSSPAVLNLPPGSVVGMNMSSNYIPNQAQPLLDNVQLPPLFDGSVFGIIDLLANRGVSTILSIGNDLKKVDGILENLAKTSAILVGAIIKEDQKFKLN